MTAPWRATPLEIWFTKAALCRIHDDQWPAPRYVVLPIVEVATPIDAGIHLDSQVTGHFSLYRGVVLGGLRLYRCLDPASQARAGVLDLT